MPGSLGVETVYQMFQTYVLNAVSAEQFKSPRFSLIPGSPVEWKYRGQITPNTGQMSIQVDLKPVKSLPGQVSLTGDASVWADQVRIYEIRNVGIRLIESV
jgi:3-hydroxymyristoyl/3-hydroxydecanoyl-(acyl carrier protein) dehydratase